MRGLMLSSLVTGKREMKPGRSSRGTQFGRRGMVGANIECGHVYFRSSDNRRESRSLCPTL